MGGVLLLVVAVILLGLIGWWATGALGIESLALRSLAAYAASWAALVVCVVALSLPGWLSRGWLVLAIAVLAAGSLAVRRWRSTGPAARAGLEWKEPLADPVVRSLAIAVAVAGVYLAALAFSTTPNDWDGLTYHETRALLWDQQGRIGYVPSGNEPRLDGNPPVSEIGLYLAMLLPRSERFARSRSSPRSGRACSPSSSSPGVSGCPDRRPRTAGSSSRPFPSSCSTEPPS